MKRFFCIVMLVALIITSMSDNLNINRNVMAAEISATYIGRKDTEAINNNLQFKDVPNTHWAKEPITRLGALNIVKGYNEGNAKNYKPEKIVSVEESIAFILRIIGMEDEAQQAAYELETNDENTLSLWSKGYLSIAKDLELITDKDLEDALTEDQTALKPEENFIRTKDSTREQVAEWLVKAINNQNPDIIAPLYNQQSVFNYSDWEEATPDKIPYIEAAIQNKIMIGDNNHFRPKDGLTRAQMAQLIKNVDELLYNTMNIEQKNGYVEEIKDESIVSSSKQGIRNFYIRNEDGQLVMIQYKNIVNGDKKTKLDATVNKKGVLSGLLEIKKGDKLEYLINPITNEVLYINNNGEAEEKLVKGILQPIDLNTGSVTVKSDNKSMHTFNLMNDLYDIENNTIIISDNRININTAPIGTEIILTLKNNMVTNMKYYSMEAASDEISGIVKEINTKFGYITIVDWNTGEDITKQFYRDQIKVEKQMYYDAMDEVGYIDEIFDIDEYDEKDTTIENIKVGDIVHIKLKENDKEIIENISAKTNYMIKYGEIKKINYNNEEDYEILVENEDESLQNYEITEKIILKKGNNIVQAYELEVGSWIKLLVNQAVIEPGYTIDKVKEISVDLYQKEIANIYKGRLGSYNPIQKELTIFDKYNLANDGWRSYEISHKFMLDNNMEIYYNGKRVDLNYATKLSNTNAFIATEKYYDSEKICRINLTDTRDTVLDFDYVLDSNGGNLFTLFGTNKQINTDLGTIIVRDGRLVDATNIISPDYTQVVLQSSNKAAIVNIQREPGNNALTISRGRVKNIEDNQTVVFSSQGILKEMKWIYSPIERTYVIDYNTLIIGEEGITGIDSFKDYGETSQVDDVYTIVSEGTKAKYLVKNPHCTEGISGKIYELGEDNIAVRDVLVYNTSLNKWQQLSLTNSYGTVTIPKNSIILKNNKRITSDELEIGDKIKVLTDENLADKLKLESSREVTGYIMLVE